MMATLVDVVTQLQKHASTMSGIRQAPSKPPESLNEFPFAVSACRRGNWTVAPAGVMQLIGTFVTQVHVARQDLPVAFEQAMAYGDSYPKLIWNDPTLNSLVSTVNEVRGTFADMEYGGVKTLGWDFEIDVKMQITL